MLFTQIQIELLPCSFTKQVATYLTILELFHLFSSHNDTKLEIFNTEIKEHTPVQPVAQKKSKSNLRNTKIGTKHMRNLWNLSWQHFSGVILLKFFKFWGLCDSFVSCNLNFFDFY